MKKYSTYILIYLKDDIVVGISGNASSMNFDGTVSYGTSAATLVSNGWVDVDWYKTTAGNAAAYSKDVDNARSLHLRTLMEMTRYTAFRSSTMHIRSQI